MRALVFNSQPTKFLPMGQLPRRHAIATTSQVKQFIRNHKLSFKRRATFTSYIAKSNIEHQSHHLRLME